MLEAEVMTILCAVSDDVRTCIGCWYCNWESHQSDGGFSVSEDLFLNTGGLSEKILSVYIDFLTLIMNHNF